MSIEGGPHEEWHPIRMSTALWLQLGATRVDWGEPDADGFYTPTLYGDARHAHAFQDVNPDAPCPVCGFASWMHDPAQVAMRSWVIG